MNEPLLWLTVLLLGLLLLSATVSIALRLPSRVRMEERLRAAGRENLMSRLIEFHADLAFAAAFFRTACSLALVLVLLRFFRGAIEAEELVVYLVTWLVALVLVLVFGVAIPSAWAKYAGEALLAPLLPLLLLAHRLLRPITKVLHVSDRLIRRLVGVSPDEEADDAAERELLAAVSEGEKTGAVDEEEKEMIESIIEFRDSNVVEIMTPRTEIAAVPKTATIPEIKGLIREIGHSRIPVYDETIDNVVGVLYAKDLLHVADEPSFDLAAVMRPATFVPETKNLRDLLRDFRTQKVHIAIVLDEYGGTAGLVTIEDLLEELVGEIADEYDTDEPAPITRIDEDTFDADARMSIYDLNAELDVHLPEDRDFETIGGFVFSELGRIPAKGESCTHENVTIQVLDAEARRIKRLRLHVQREAQSLNGHE